MKNVGSYNCINCAIIATFFTWFLSCLLVKKLFIFVANFGIIKTSVKFYRRLCLWH